MSSANSGSFTSSFPIWISHFLFGGLLAVTRSSNTMLDSSGKSIPSHLLPDPRGKFSLFTIDIMLAVSLSYIAFIMLRYVPF